MLCVNCRVRESTGVVIALCDECFERLEAATAARRFDEAAALAGPAFQVGDGLRVGTFTDPKTGQEKTALFEGPRTPDPAGSPP